MSVYFCADLHLGHQMASEKRGFRTIEEHDHFVIQSLLKVCTKRTVLYVLGDVAMQLSSLDLLGQVPGRKKLIFGNHDEYPLEEYLKYFETVHGFIKYKGMWLSHCPIHPQEFFGKPNVHGHIHKNTRSPELPYPYINMNWDFWRRPVSLDEIKVIIKDNQELQDKEQLKLDLSVGK